MKCRDLTIACMIVGTLALLAPFITASAQTIRFLSIRTAVYAIPPGGADVDFDLQTFGWGYAAGALALGPTQSTADPYGIVNRVDRELRPRGWSASRSDDAYQANRRSEEGGDLSPGTPPFDPTSITIESGSLSGWQALGPYGGNVVAVAVSPVNSSIVLAGVRPDVGTPDLFRSTDGGDTWFAVANLNFESSAAGVYDIEFASDGTAYIGTWQGVWKSIDSGATWTELELNLGPPTRVFEVAIDGTDAESIWVGLAGGTLLNSTDGGATWTDVGACVCSLNCLGIAIDPSDSNTVAASFGSSSGWGGGVWVSRDGGATWSDRSAGLPNGSMNDIVYDGSRLLVVGGGLAASSSVGLFESGDAGVTWTALHDGTWPSLSIHDIAIDPNDPDVLLVASFGAGAFRSADGGVSWTFGVGDTASVSVNAVRFAPGSSARILLGATSRGVLQSFDSGSSFENTSEGIGANDITSVDANPNDGTELAASFQGLNDGGVYTSVDGGENWTLEDLPPTRYSVVRFAPDGTLYAISDGPRSIAPEGVYRRNPDNTWTGLGPDQGELFVSQLVTLRFSQNDANLILAGGADWGNAGFEATIWLSTDAGAHWAKKYEGPENFQMVREIAIVEDGTDSVIVACFTDFGMTQTGGTLRSTDGGNKWVQSNAGLPVGVEANSLAASPTDPSTFYLADAGGGSNPCPEPHALFKTTDAGQTWASTGYATETFLVVGEPTDANVLYIIDQYVSPLARISFDAGATFVAFDSGLEAAGLPTALTYSSGPPVPALLLATTTGTYTRPAETADSNPPLLADPPNDRLKNRYISFKPNNSGKSVKLKVTLSDSLPHPGLIGSSWWVLAPIVPDESNPKPLLATGECVALLGSEDLAAAIDWDAAGCRTLHVTGCPIEPTSEYEVQAVIRTIESAAVAVATTLKPGVKWWGDTIGFFNGVEWTPPNLTVNIDDAVAGIKTWQGGQVVAPIPGSNIAHLSVADVEPGNMNTVVDFNDVFTVILAFQGEVYPFGPADADGNCP